MTKSTLSLKKKDSMLRKKPLLLKVNSGLFEGSYIEEMDEE